ncbi:hypothetical protein GCM10011608_02530 [Micromonospora sonchi]|uniref:N-acetyltransferase domain-containing protein n=1 Tax=Micromonospora sonchi TaxID=1763543 RepID=A0A917TFA5_9ACTN|nr:GNAT family N-acetyltransferase [Micromonospora sonchi]GGM21359.1 hypothetical protein GCM10011608_02530 [Micromonospora sonchi]
MKADVDLSHFDAGMAAALTDELVEVYLDAHAGDGAFYNEDRYRRQLAGHMKAPGWTLITAQIDGHLVGYIYGFPLQQKTRWWEGIRGGVPDAFTDDPTFALCELLVRPAWQRQGIARALHDELIDSRPEPRMTLLARPDNAPAQAAYRSWNWHKVGELQPAWENAPVFDVLVREGSRHPA